MQDYLDRWREGEREAADLLLRATGDRLLNLANYMTRAFPNVLAQTDTDDVLQNSLIRLLRTLQTIRPATTRDYFNLAAVHIRRELLDLARKCNGKQWFPLKMTDDSQLPPSPTSEPAVAPPAPDFEVWVRFHEAVDELPNDERELVGLVFYQGLSQLEIATLFGVAERTIRRRWSLIRDHLRGIVGEDCT